MRSFVTGANGQVGKRLAQHLGDQARTVTRLEWNLENPESGRDLFFSEPWNAVYHCAAYTAVDLAETESEKLRNITVRSTEALGKWCAESRTPLVYYSTDYVFSETSANPISEITQKNPVNAYGKAKSEAEQILLDLAKMRSLKLIVLRTQWVYDYEGKNFFTAILRKLNQESRVRVVMDQFGQTTWAKDLAEASCDLVQKNIFDDLEFQKFPVLHFRQEGEKISWFDFASAIREEAEKRHLLPENTEVIPISTLEYPTLAKRPGYSLLSVEKIKNFGIKPLPWRNALAQCMNEQ